MSEPEKQKPNPALKRLDKLVGTWNMIGRTFDSDHDNITGSNRFEWLPGGFFMESRGEINFNGHLFQSTEIIGYDPATDTFPSTVYSNMASDPTQYHWNVQGDTVTHWENTSKYTGKLSEDGKTLSGGWRANQGAAISEGSNYDAVMTRTN